MRNSIYEEQSVRYWHLTGRRKSLMGNICSPVSVCSHSRPASNRWLLSCPLPGRQGWSSQQAYCCMLMKALFPQETNSGDACILSHVQLLATLQTVACQVPLSMGFSRQEYCSVLPGPPPRALPNPGIEQRCLTSQADSLPSQPPGKSRVTLNELNHNLTRHSAAFLRHHHGKGLMGISDLNEKPFQLLGPQQRFREFT